MNDGVSGVRKAHEPVLKTRNLDGLRPAALRERPGVDGSFDWRLDQPFRVRGRCVWDRFEQLPEHLRAAVIEAVEREEYLAK